jgi:hypothetical protein
MQADCLTVALEAAKLFLMRESVSSALSAGQARGQAGRLFFLG